MTSVEWSNLSVGNMVFLNSNPSLILKVVEICNDEKSLSNWRNRGYDPQSIIKFENNLIHTWDCRFERWSMSN